VPKRLDLPEAKARVLELIAAGDSVEKAMGAVDRTVRTWESWRKSDPEFARQVDEIRAARKRRVSDDADVEVPVRRDMPFAEWRKEYLGFDTYAHQQQWIDVLEGREPQPTEGCEWDERNRKRLIINVPPFHAKSQTITVDYVTYRICMNPNVRIIIVSKRGESAQKFLYQIQQRLTSTRFAKLQAAFAPDGGFKPEKGEGSFSQKVMYVAGRTADHKDPTVEVLGMGAQIYGSRADLIILDDAITGANANEFEKQVYWLESEVESRVKNGTILLVGTRLAGQDLYSELRVDDRYLNGRSPWSYLRQPMVLAFSEDPKDWKTLWPHTSTPLDELEEEPDENGLYPAWDGPACAKVRDSKPPAVWSLVYQQQQTAEDATFKPICVLGSVNGQRKPGPLKAGAFGHPRRGKEGMYTIASMDPGMGVTFAVVGSVDRKDSKRWIENAWVLNSPSPTSIRDLIKRVTDEYGVQEWVIEEQGFQSFLTQDPEIRAFLASRGVRMSGHYTGRNKLDPDFGVASLSGLFGSTRRINEGAGREVFNRDNLIELPDQNMSAGIKALIEQLLTWVPGKRGSKLTQDGPMALWFFDLRARVILGHDRGREPTQHVAIPFMSRGAQKKQASAPFAWGQRRRVAGG
jgi:hypothetical protein